ncbi:MAG: hypothetical protein E7C50_00265 [Clostridium sp.]|uniref:hypothetical protein n=1 Tax=Clostridium sp. TaxID=1506 RepID=UPI0028FDD0D3|nr:hypothetical protein [Clostridium sp.]MDU2674197.1 hypothetical protein [Clostridium sp.]MDU2680292.1 hypothetical protein [Clostridium sp.]
MKAKIIMTKGVNSLIENGTFNDKDLLSSLIQFTSNDWGILSDEDKKLQDELLLIPNSEYNERFMGVYMIHNIKIWFFREYDYSIDTFLTTILLPEEY